MFKSTTITKSSYNSLLTSIRQEIKAGLENLKKYVEQQKVLIYWKVGRQIFAYTARNGGGLKFYQRLSADTGLSVRILQSCCQLGREYPRLNTRRLLSWSHYRYLMTIESAAEREQWERRIIKESLSAEDFARLLQDRRFEKRLGLDPVTRPVAAVQRGVLYVYRLTNVSYAQDVPDGLMVDCGFEIRIVPPPATAQINNRHLVRSEKIDGAYRLKIVDAAAADIYTYKAIIEKVIDGDGLRVNIDVGFGIWIRQRLRFRGIDAPERGTQAGERALRWLKAELAPCPFVVIKTYKSDKYDRYLVDVFYAPGEAAPHAVAEKGKLINAVMLEKGLASPWK